MSRKIIILFSCLALVVLSVALWLSPLNKYLYGCDVTADYHYRFSQDSRRVLYADSRISDDHFTMPQNMGNWDTGFLKINLKSTLIGKIIEPYIEFEMQGKKVKQYFMRGTEGIRYLNISSLSGQNVDKVTIRGHHLIWDPQDGQLLLFSNRKISQARILVISPHPDDAELATFGLYSHRDSFILTITDGGDSSAKNYDYLFSDVEKENSYAMKAKLRVIDSLTVPYIGDISPLSCINLGYFDGTLREMKEFPSIEVHARYSKRPYVSISRKYNLYPLQSLPAEATWNNLVRNISMILDKIQPDIIVAPHPLLDSHPDHKFSSMSLFEALAKSRICQKSSLFLHTNHGGDYYPYGTSESIVSLPPLFQIIIYSTQYILISYPQINMSKRDSRSMLCTI
ncbi:MAG: hypothetical protein STSR0002_08460 [Smithella sp.]|jgi:hypothetical protein